MSSINPTAPLPSGCAALTLGGGCFALLVWLSFWIGLLGLIFGALLKYVFGVDVTTWL